VASASIAREDWATAILAESGRKRADSAAINRAEAALVKGAAELSCKGLTGAGTLAFSARPEPLQHLGGGKSVGGRPDRGLEAAQRLPGLPAELAVRGAAIEAALGQKLLQF
jgi:hypothetical protein